MRILVFSETFHPKFDGVVTSVLNSTRLLTEKGHQLGIIAPEYYTRYKEIRMKNLKVFRISSFALPFYEGFQMAYPNIKKCLEIVDDFKPDVIHVTGPGTLGTLGVLVAKYRKIPLVGTYHTAVSEFLVLLSPSKLVGLDKKMKSVPESSETQTQTDDAEFLRDFKGFTDKMRKRLTRGVRVVKKSLKIKKKKSSRPLHKRAIWSLVNQFYNRCDLVTSPSQAILKELKRHHLKTRGVFVSNGVDLSRFKKKLRYAKSPVRLLHVGRLSFEKNIDVLLKAMRIVADEKPDLVLHIVGDGPARDRLEDMVDELGLRDNVRFLGFVENSRLPRVYRTHDIFVTASTIETQGLVIIEAMASGLPVIGVNALAIPDLVHNDVNGFVTPLNHQQMAKRILQVAGNYRLRKRMGEHAVSEAQKHELHACVGQLEECFRSVIEDYNKEKNSKQ